MNSQRLELGRVDDVHVESFGEPGQRTFRIHVEKVGGTVSLWLEKFQVEMLGTAIGELLTQTPEVGPMEDTDPGITFMGDLEVRVGSMALGYNVVRNSFLIEASEFESAFDLEQITFELDRDQFTSMQSEIDTIVAASRPRCVLCGTPLTGEPHFCPEQNGHTRLKADEPD